MLGMVDEAEAAAKTKEEAEEDEVAEVLEARPTTQEIPPNKIANCIQVTLVLSGSMIFLLIVLEFAALQSKQAGATTTTKEIRFHSSYFLGCFCD